MIYILIGKSGVGKNHIQERLIQKGFERIVPVTDRLRRLKEVEGVDYFFKSKDNFTSLIESGDIFEYRTYHVYEGNIPDTTRYGSLKQDLDQSKNYVIIGTVDSAISWIDAYGKDRIAVIHIKVSDKIRTERVQHRPSFNPLEWTRRLKTDAEDYSEERLKMLEEYLGKPLLLYINE